MHLAKENQGWATWDTWFAAHDSDPPNGAIRRFNSDVYLLEACVSGQGIALAWRQMMGRYLDQGALVRVSETTVRTDAGFFMEVTETGVDRTVVARAIQYFTQSMD